jgi:RNA ligase
MAALDTEKGNQVKFTELFSFEELELELQNGFVKEQLHPTLPLTILNYTDKATYERRWNNVTTHCRGLIVDMDTDEVIARGPRKFFNYGEPSATEYPLDTPVRLTRKEDGSLGIGWAYYDAEEGLVYHDVATRGSFTSDQAEHAGEVLTNDDRANIDFAETGGYSRMWEIVYPENRIVLDYGDRDELIPLGTVDNKTGLILYRPNSVLAHGIPAIMTLAEAIALPIPDDEEGYVLDILDEYLSVVDHLKLKGARYKELHAAIFGLTEARVYEAWLKDGAADLIEGLPDEVQPWALAVAQRLDGEWEDLNTRVLNAFERVPQGTRSQQAQYILFEHKELAPALFAMLDFNTEKTHTWVDKQIKPGHVPFSATKESVTQ